MGYYGTHDTPSKQRNFTNNNIGYRCLKMVERRLQQNEQLRIQYIHFMREYQTLGHMRQLPTEEITSGQHFYMPHHPVLGRKLRVVFDGSFRDANETGIQNEVKTNCLSTLAESQLDNPREELIARVSSWWKLVHTIGYVLRFIQRTKHPKPAFKMTTNCYLPRSHYGADRSL
ncbi:uncharacterized protein LOC117192918 [Drosophila miranda]|uniref:uncharacterized protein LOC117192918 n=1 Tax=Drosophila miranda TaxID=7229 RepID=UPI00143F278B|nr:uncharacterized protein LOC117192918 [Drosophila miranda]